MRTVVLVAALAILVASLGGCATNTGAATDSHHSGAGGQTSVDAGVSSIPHRSVAPMPSSHLAKGLVPPTNRWFSGLVFGASHPVFPLPLSFGLTSSGFAFGVPTVRSTANTIFGEYAPTVSIGDAAASSVVVAYDAASVTIELKDSGGSGIGQVVIAEGSPVVSYTALRNGTLDTGVAFAGAGRVRTSSAAGSTYGLVTGGKLNGTKLTLAKGQTAQWFAVPNGQSPSQLGARVSSLRSVSVDYAVKSGTATTTLTYHSTGENLVAALPQQIAGLVSPHSCTLGSYRSIFGTLSLCSGRTLAWSTPKVTPSDSMNASKLSPGDQQILSAQLAKDVSASQPLPPDTYFGGKALYRLANLLSIAHQLGDSAQAKTIQSRLDAALEKWTTPQGCATRSSECFVYDPKAKGIVGLQASFGSDQFNDHDFHYGYFLYAASVASKYNSSLTSRIAPAMNLLAADIGSIHTSSAFPVRRLFDAYSGHSWASGYAPFADGNNQESSSEAVNAWNGLALWAETTHNTPLAVEATWMLSSEAASAKAQWTNFDRSDLVYSGYQHPTVGINWGGKRDYASWFSASSNAILGIQLIPMSPASTYLVGDSIRNEQNVNSAAPLGFDVQFGDYLLMYSDLAGATTREDLVRAARELPAKDIDDADSRTYLLTWIMTH